MNKHTVYVCRLPGNVTPKHVKVFVIINAWGKMKQKKHAIINARLMVTRGHTGLRAYHLTHSYTPCNQYQGIINNEYHETCLVIPIIQTLYYVLFLLLCYCDITRRRVATSETPVTWHNNSALDQVGVSNTLCGQVAFLRHAAFKNNNKRFCKIWTQIKTAQIW